MFRDGSPPPIVFGQASIYDSLTLTRLEINDQQRSAEKAPEPLSHVVTEELEQQCCQLSLYRFCWPNQRLTNRWNRWWDDGGMFEHSKFTAVHFLCKPYPVVQLTGCVVTRRSPDCPRMVDSGRWPSGLGRWNCHMYSRGARGSCYEPLRTRTGYLGAPDVEESGIVGQRPYCRHSSHTTATPRPLCPWCKEEKVLPSASPSSPFSDISGPCPNCHLFTPGPSFGKRH